MRTMLEVYENNIVLASFPFSNGLGTTATLSLCWAWVASCPSIILRCQETLSRRRRVMHISDILPRCELKNDIPSVTSD